MTISIVGLGYVGLPLCLQFARNGVAVVGLDVDAAKVSAVNEGRSYIKHIEASAVAEQVSAGRLSASSDFSLIRDVEAVIICVPTPLNRYREPDMSFVLNTGTSIAPYLKRGILVVLE
jgi:UDP-N-acetyl-D-glucosamine dehydrogenase